MDVIDTNQTFKKFLIKNLDSDSALEEESEDAIDEIKNFFAEKQLTQIPIFSLNEDYIKALANILSNRLKKAKQMLDDFKSTI